MTRALVLTLATLMAIPSTGLAQAPNPTDVQAALAELKREPTVRDVQEAALQYFRVNQGQIDSMRSRARIKALAPVLEVSGGYTKSELDDVSTNAAEGFTTFNDPWVVRGSGGMGWNIRAKMTLNLPRLVFNPEELDVASLAGLVEGILKESTRLYYMRRRLQVDMILKPPTDQATMLSKQLRIEELTAMLDAMTGGWYQNALDITAGRKSRTEVRAPIGTPRVDVTTMSLPSTAPQKGLKITPAAAGR